MDQLPNFTFIPTRDQIENSNIFSFMKKNNIQSLEGLLEKSRTDPEWFWDRADKDLKIFWYKRFHSVCDSKKGKPWTRFFVGGVTNIYCSCVEKFASSQPQKLAFIFLSEDENERQISYGELDRQVCKLANGLVSLDIGKGDVVAIYMPMIAEAIFTILACAKIGAIHTVIFSGYSAESLKMRIQDCNAKILVTSDGFIRKGKPVSQKKVVENVINETGIKKIILVGYKGFDTYDDSKFVLYNDLVQNQKQFCETRKLDSETDLFILYTSGTTGRPKGAVHTHGRISVFAAHQCAYLIDLKNDDILFWPADIGWITGLIWNVYGLLECGATAILYDGAPDWPNLYKAWNIIRDYKVTIFGTSPTMVRMLKRENARPSMKDLGSIRIVASTGEPMDQDSWIWLFNNVCFKRIPIMNLVGGTEAGGALLSVLPGMRLKPSTVGMPCPGIDADCWDENGKPLRNEVGVLVVKSPWPGMTKSLLNDDKRFLETYWSKFKDVWFHGDFVSIDEDDLWYMRGRVDDVIKVSGHRLSTAEIEQCLITHPKVSDSAIISIPDELTGEAIVAFVVLTSNSDHMENELMEYVSQKIGKLAKPKSIKILNDLPKTRTGKTIRRVLRAKILGLPLGDLSSIENPEVLDQI